MLDNHVVIANSTQEITNAWKGFTPLFATFASSTQSAASQTNGHIANTIDGYWLELLKCGQSDTEMGSPTLQSAPYSTRLRPTKDISGFSTFTEIYLTKATFQALDVTLTGDANQDSAVLTEIEDSLVSANDAYVQSRFLMGEIGGWLPNFFMPYISIKSGTNVFNSLAMSNFDTKNNIGDLSMGIMLPYEYIPPVPAFLGKMMNSNDCIEVFCGCGQIVDDGGTKKIQRYPIIAQFEFLGVII